MKPKSVPAPAGEGQGALPEASETQPKPPLDPVRAPSEPALDHGIEESFPASDPVSVKITRIGRTRWPP